MKKRIVLILLVIVMSSSMVYALPVKNRFFVKSFSYKDGQFSDVKSGSWYEPYIKEAYEYGLINGTSATTFTPTGNLLIAEAIALACRIDYIYYGKCDPIKSTTPWYQGYIEYAIKNNIISESDYFNYDALATRSQVANIFAKALPKEALCAINYIDIIPDVPYVKDSTDAIYMLYEAGVLTGSDKYGTFNPDDNITRAEIATIVTRMADESLRLIFHLESKPIIYLPTTKSIPAPEGKTVLETEPFVFVPMQHNIAKGSSDIIEVAFIWGIGTENVYVKYNIYNYDKNIVYCEWTKWKYNAILQLKIVGQNFGNAFMSFDIVDGNTHGNIVSGGTMVNVY